MLACDSRQTETTGAGVQTETTHDHAGEQDLAYVCPMRCEGSASNEPGTCPVCEMKLVKNPDYRPAEEPVTQ